MARDVSTLGELLARLPDLTDDAILVGEAPDGPDSQVIVWCNPAFEAMTGYALAELVGRSPTFLRGRGSDGAEVGRIHADWSSGQGGTAEILNYRKDGAPFWVEISVKPVDVADAAAPYIVSVQRDVTARKRREQALRDALEEQSLLGWVVEAVSHEIHILDAADLRFLRVNGQARRQLGYSSRELRAMSAAAILSPGDAAALREAAASLQAGGGAAPQRRMQRRRDGSSYPCAATLTFLERGGRGMIVAVVDDLSQREAAMAAAADSEQSYRLAVEASCDGVWDRRLPGDFVRYSPRNREMLGLDEAEFPDTVDSWRRHVHPDDRGRVTAAMQRCIDHGAPFDEVYRMRRKDGARLWWRSRAAVLRDETGAAVRVLGVNSDVTELVEAREAAEQAARLKAEFLAKMSHEIRTPMNGILGMAELMRFCESDPRQLSRLDTIASSGRSLMGIIEDVLTMARIGAGGDVAREEAFALDALCRSAFDPVRAVALAKGLTLAHDCPDGVWRGDARRLRLVLINLVGNAVKFTEAGGVRIAVSLRDGAMRFEVSDTGPGVPEALRETIFEPFRQADDSATRRHGGLGLGLSIAREFVQAMGGRIGCGEAAAGGAVFWFDAPVAREGAAS